MTPQVLHDNVQSADGEREAVVGPRVDIGEFTVLDCAVTSDPGRLPDQHHLGLPGHPGRSDIVGNRVNDRFRLAAYEPSIGLPVAAARHDRPNPEARPEAQTRESLPQAVVHARRPELAAILALE